MNSRQKGKRGELEWAHWLQARGFAARRGCQFQGGPDSPDVVCPALPIHWEVKRTEAGNPYMWLDQAQADAGPGQTPVVAHRRNERDWVVVLSAADFLALISPKATT